MEEIERLRMARERYAESDGVEEWQFKMFLQQRGLTNFKNLWKCGSKYVFAKQAVQAERLADRSALLAAIDAVLAE